ncbi:long-chain fatty acid--CoA ligase [Amycolatopsis sp. K13G38]|uniref:Long-chain fatty acid--CoA ligase n=1 Tax=Amycolatopsis acididurans TaxID=2724524 RepID=A0ABX1JB51_9PSEU|nr:fatty acid--CoA ligase family protein [Amycolatopsis acididurans]NKQ56719.1 long-chain fatty acid--CoA ligase [Amycolatopsis acididurans]
MNIAMLLDMAADSAGDRRAVGDTTFAELREQARAVGGQLTARGAGRLVLAGVNSEAIPAMVFGSALAQVPFTAVNYRLADDRLREVLARAAPAVVVADERTRPRIEGVPKLDFATEGELLAPAPAEPGDGGSEVAIALFTSGTTGTPKLVLLRHHNLVSYILSTVEFMAAEPDEAALVSVPQYHIAGMAAVLSNVYLGRRLVYLPQFEPRQWVETAARERVTHAMIVPTMLGRILDLLEQTGTELPHLRHLSYGGGRMPTPVVERAMTLLPHVGFVNAYGLTETSSTIALLGPADHRTAAASGDPTVRARLGSVGRAVPGVEIEIRDADGGVLPAGEVGEVFVRGEQVAGEYEGTDARDADGWFRTNDNGRLDAEGYLFIEGRADDVIVRGGENMSPGEIEDVLFRHPAVAEVAVVGVPDTEWGETVAAAVVFEPGRHADADELRTWVTQRLRSSRAPSIVVERDALPYSETGKLLRRALRAELAAVPADRG